MTTNGKLGKAKRFLRWLHRQPHINNELIEASALSLAKLMTEYGYDWVDMEPEGYPPVVYSLAFCKLIKVNQYRYVDVYFDKYRRFQFTCNFGIRTKTDEYRADLMGDYSEKPSGLLRHKLWGACWYHIDKKSKFLNDWNELEGMIPHIVKFLEDRTTHPRIAWVAFVRDSKGQTISKSGNMRI